MFEIETDRYKLALSSSDVKTMYAEVKTCQRQLGPKTGRLITVLWQGRIFGVVFFSGLRWYEIWLT